MVVTIRYGGFLPVELENAWPIEEPSNLLDKLHVQNQNGIHMNYSTKDD